MTFQPSPSFRSSTIRNKSAPHQGVMTIALVMCLIQFTGAWIYPPNISVGVEMLQLEKVMGVPFQWAVWGMAVLGLLWHVQKFGFSRIFVVTRVVLPFAFIGLITGLLGINPFLSIRFLIMWGLVVICAGVIGSELDPERAKNTLCRILLVLMVGSIVMAVGFPFIGQQGYGSTLVWRGLFTNKNQLGWVSGLTLIIAMSIIDRKTWKLSVFTALVASICLIFSSSKGALLAALFTIGYVYALVWLAPRVTTGFGVFATTTILFLAGVFAFLLLPYVLEMLGRDATLTGRTDVWHTYFTAMVRTPWLGEGAGSYTSLSSLTLPLAQRLASLGIIVTPHNIFLGVLGDMGLFGLVAFIGMHLYLTLTRPFLYQSRFVIVCSGVGFMMVAHGMVETHEVMGPGPAWFLLILAYALSLQEQHGAPTLFQRRNVAPQS